MLCLTKDGKKKEQETNEIEKTRPSGSQNGQSIGVHASENENSESDDEDNPLRSAEIKDLGKLSKPLYRNQLDLNATIVSNGDSEKGDHHF